ncbi:hypothetical protein C0J52_06416 [Blattella germanica]|nr:hypothetical protein C0J52_06416 [Blattella germanica]
MMDVKNECSSDSVVLASYEIAHLKASGYHPLTDGDYIKNCFAIADKVNSEHKQGVILQAQQFYILTTAMMSSYGRHNFQTQHMAICVIMKNYFKQKPLAMITKQPKFLSSMPGHHNTKPV